MCLFKQGGKMAMKKVLTLALAMVLCFGVLPMLPKAYQQTPAIGFSSGADILDDSNIEDFGNIILGTDRNTLVIPVKWEGFTGATGPDDITEEMMNDMKLYSDPPQILDLFEHIEMKRDTGDAGPYIELTCSKVGDAIGYLYVEWLPEYREQGTRAYSQRVPINGRFIDPTIDKKITGIKDTSIADGKNIVFLNGKAIDESEVDGLLNDLQVGPGSELMFRLHTDNFYWEPNITNMRTAVRKSTLDSDKVTVYKKILAGDNTIDEIVIENLDGTAYVIVRFAEVFDSVKDRDFDFQVMLAKDKKSHELSGVRVMGTLSNEVYYVDSDYDYVNLEEGNVVEATQFVKGIRVNMGSGVTTICNMQPDKKYYGRTSEKLTDLDREIMDHYRFFKRVIHLKTVNFPEATKVEIESDVEYFVYDGKGNYLGTTKENLALVETYYLSAEKYMGEILAAAGEFVAEDDNDNPSTGAADGILSGFVGIAFILGGAAVGLRKNRRDHR